MDQSPVIRIAAAVIVDHEGRLLLVRKRGTHTFMQPGGKVEPGEASLEALVRELDEELGLAEGPERYDYIGQFAAVAANEIGHVVDAEVYSLRTVGPEVAIAAEIDEMRWVSPEEMYTIPVAPLTLDNLSLFLGWRTRRPLASRMPLPHPQLE